jgi:hypothetical protein
MDMIVVGNSEYKFVCCFGKDKTKGPGGMKANRISQPAT